MAKLLWNTPPPMLWTMPRVLYAKPRLVVFPVFLIIAFFFFLPRQYHGATNGATNLSQVEIQDHIVETSEQTVEFQGKTATESASVFNATVRDFWQDLAAALLEARPQCAALAIVPGDMPDVTWEPLKQNKKPKNRILGFTDDHEKALFKAHYLMRSAAKNLAPKLPFAANTTGIVTTANAAYMPILLVSLRMLRKTGNDLPIEVFIDDWSTYDPDVCDTLLPSLNARCLVLSNIYDSAPSVAKPDHFQYKIFAILFSSFQHVLFLDSDSIAAHDPSVLFTAPPYTTHGLVTWPDFWELSISPHFYHIAAIPEEPVEKRLTSESGQVMINKDIHRESLLMMVYYNYYGPEYYYILLSQGLHGAGDKETFAQAALATNLPYYQVKTLIRPLGRIIDKTFYFVGMSQADPMQDFTYQTPMPNHIHPDIKWTEDDAAAAAAASHSSIANPSNQTTHATAPPLPRMFFLHHNLLKLSPHSVLENKKGLTFAADGSPHRMWGPAHEMVPQIGYDAEQRLWDVITLEACRPDPGHEKCQELTAFNTTLFGPPREITATTTMTTTTAAAAEVTP